MASKASRSTGKYIYNHGRKRMEKLNRRNNYTE